MIGEDFFILPSSVHEVLLMPESVAMSPQALVTMVQEINQLIATAIKEGQFCEFIHIQSAQPITSAIKLEQPRATVHIQTGQLIVAAIKVY